MFPLSVVLHSDGSNVRENQAVAGEHANQRAQGSGAFCPGPGEGTLSVASGNHLPWGMRVEENFPSSSFLSWRPVHSLQAVRALSTSFRSEIQSIQAVNPIAGPPVACVSMLSAIPISAESSRFVRSAHLLESLSAAGVGDGQGSLVCCSLRGRKGSDITEGLN